MFELDGDFDIDDAFLQDTFQQASGNLNQCTPETDSGKRTFSEDEPPLCSKRNRVDSVHLLDNSYDNDGVLDHKQVLSDSPRETSNKIVTIQSTPDIFGAQLPSSSDCITHNESNLRRDTPTKGTAVDLNHSIRQRKFPGPAGLLPEKNCVLSSKLIDLNSPELEQPPQEPLCSQRSVAVFEGAPWQKMLQDFGLNRKSGSPLEKLTVSWIRTRAAARQLVGQKVPFLAVALQSIDCSSPDPCLVLRDKTGEMFGTLHRDVWEQHGDQLVSGAVLVLRQAGVVSTGPAARRHYLNITLNNLLTIYTPTDSEECVKETQLHEVSHKELIDAVEEWQALNVKTAKNCASSSLSTLGNSSQHVGTALWNTPGSGARNLLSDRNTTPHQEGVGGATSSRAYNTSLPSVSSTKVKFDSGKKGANSSCDTFQNERIIYSKHSDAKSNMYIHNSRASNECTSSPILGTNRSSAIGVQHAYKPKTPVIDALNSFSPITSQSSTPKSSGFNLKMPVLRDLMLTPANQTSEAQRTCKFTPKFPNKPAIPARQSNDSILSCSLLNNAEGSLEVPKGGKFSPKVPNRIPLTPAAESLGTPKSSQFTLKMPTVTQRMTSSSSLQNVSPTKSAANISHSNNNNKCLKEEELHSILGGLDTSSLFDDDF